MTNKTDQTSAAETTTPATHETPTFVVDTTKTPEKPTHRPSGLPGDALMDERRNQYSAHLPLNPLKMSQVPTELRSLPEFVALEAERTAVHEVERSIARQHEAWQLEVQLAQGLHEAAMRDALLNGTPPPPPLALPAWPYQDRPAEILLEFHRVITATEAGLLEENADEYAAAVSEASAEARERLAEAHRLVTEAEAAVKPFDLAGKALQRFRRGRSGDDGEPNDRERRDLRRTRHGRPEADQEEPTDPRVVEQMLQDQHRPPSRRNSPR